MPKAEDEDEDAYAFRMPTGRPAELSCEEARRVVAQVRTGLAYEPDGVSAHALATFRPVATPPTNTTRSTSASAKACPTSPPPCAISSAPNHRL